MTTITRRSAKRGAMAQKRAESVKGFCYFASLDVNNKGIDSEYFADAYIGYLADTTNLQKSDGEDMKALDKRADELAAAKFAAMLKSESGRADLEKSEVYKIMADADAMYKTFRAALPCFTTESGAFSFAKKKVIALLASELTKEEIKVYESKETWHKIAVMIDGREVVYFSPLAYSPEELAEGLTTTRKQRRAFLKKEEETAKYWQNINGDICGLVSLDKANYKDLAKSLSGTLQEAAAAIIRRHAEEAEAAANAKKAAETAAAFLNTAAPEKLAKLAEIAEAVATQKEANKYKKKAKESVKTQTNGLLKYMKDNGEAAADYYRRISDKEVFAADEEAIKGNYNNEAEARAKAADAAANAKAARRAVAAAELLAEMILNEETAAADLRAKAAEFAKKEAEANQEAAADAAA